MKQFVFEKKAYFTKKKQHINGRSTHEKMLNNLSNQRNVNQNHSEIPFHIYQDGHNQKDT